MVVQVIAGGRQCIAQFVSVQLVGLVSVVKFEDGLKEYKLVSKFEGRVQKHNQPHPQILE